jgi:hypothetical protein
MAVRLSALRAGRALLPRKIIYECIYSMLFIHFLDAFKITSVSVLLFFILK